jgi:hypothetical protein
MALLGRRGSRKLPHYRRTISTKATLSTEQPHMVPTPPTGPYTKSSAPLEGADFLGYPVTDKTLSEDHGGHYNGLSGGSIYYSPDSSTYGDVSPLPDSITIHAEFRFDDDTTANGMVDVTF